MPLFVLLARVRVKGLALLVLCGCPRHTRGMLSSRTPPSAFPVTKPGNNGYLAFVLPCFLGLLVFTYLPSLVSFFLSGARWDLLGPFQWVGWQNYESLLKDPGFWQMLGNTLTFVVASTVLELSLALSLSWLLFRTTRGQHALSLMLFIPYVTPMIAVSLVFGWLFEPKAGGLNALLMALGLLSQPKAWLQDPQTALWAIIALQVWKSVGFKILLLVAGLESIPKAHWEAAQLDGASPWKQWRYVALPALGPTLFFLVMTGLIQGLQAFDAVYLLTQGGPNNQTNVIVYALFKQAFEFFNVGPASAMAVLLFLVIMGLTALQWWGRKHWVWSEGDA
jgi:multiple sugar transport system permease protein